jgi:NAD(P)H-hydrate epimerase
VLVDADAITLLAKMKRQKLPKTWILTPHTGELQRLLNVPSSEIQKQRIYYVKQAAQKFGCLVLLKGFRSLISDGQTTVLIPTGNVALAKAGSGDVLTGMIVGLMAQGLTTWQAACIAATIHGYMADVWLYEGQDVLSMRASDLIQALPATLKQVRELQRK